MLRINRANSRLKGAEEGGFVRPTLVVLILRKRQENNTLKLYENLWFPLGLTNTDGGGGEG